MSTLDNLIDFRIDKYEKEAIGYIASEPYQLHDLGAPGDDIEGEQNWLWAVDVEIEGEVVRGCPIATNNKDIFYADIGRAVKVRRVNRKWVVIGLAKVKKGLKMVSYICFTDGIPTIIDEVVVGYIYRLLTYEELGSIPGSYGIFPYGAVGKFNNDGNFIELITRV